MSTGVSTNLHQTNLEVARKGVCLVFTIIYVDYIL